MNLLTRNSKIRKLKDKRTFNFGLPAGDTCPFAGECKKYCYAQKGFYCMDSVKIGQYTRLLLSMSDDFVEVMVGEIFNKRAERVRIHDSGDFYSKTYLKKWLEIARECPDVEFYAYTKSIPYFVGLFAEQIWALPNNFRVIFSFGGTHDKFVPMYNRNVCVVTTPGEAFIYQNMDYVDGSESDEAVLTNDKVYIMKH